MHKIAVIIFPGSNCELEAVRACKRSGLDAEIFRWNDDYSKLKNFDGYILPGGFSYEDRGRSGIIASKDPIMAAIKKEALEGKPLLGLCNGAQILVETGLIPNLYQQKLDIALAWNERIQEGKILGVGFYNDWIFIRSNAKSGRSVFNRFNDKVIMRIPVAHGEGRFTSQNKEILPKLIENEQALFRYCTAEGEYKDEFPTNPNGAMYNLAGICNQEGNILALMPHPERTINGQPLFDSLANYLQQKKIPTPTKSNDEIISEDLNQQSEASQENSPKRPDIVILVKLIITDNEEKTLQKTLQNIGYPDTKLERQIYFGFNFEKKDNLEKVAQKLIESGEILNLHKEVPTIFIGNQAYSYNSNSGLEKIENPFPDGFSFIITDYDNYQGKNIQRKLINYFENENCTEVQRGVFWLLKKEDEEAHEILQTYLFHNPHSMKVSKF